MYRDIIIIAGQISSQYQIVTYPYRPTPITICRERSILHLSLHLLKDIPVQNSLDLYKSLNRLPIAPRADVFSSSCTCVQLLPFSFFFISCDRFPCSSEIWTKRENWGSRKATLLRSIHSLLSSVAHF